MISMPTNGRRRRFACPRHRAVRPQWALSPRTNDRHGPDCCGPASRSATL